MRRTNSSPLRLGPALALLTMMSCFSLPKVDVIRVIDDFAEDAGLNPTWDVFGQWTCGPHVVPAQPSDAGQNGGVGADVDASQFVTCGLVIGAGDDMDPPPFPGAGSHALVASFNLSTNDNFNFEVLTRTKSETSAGSVDAGAPLQVNLTGFSQLLFNARLLSTTPGTASLPPGTELHVELNCSSSKDPLADQNVMLTPEVVTWKPVSLPLSDFMGGSQRQTCLGSVESIGFIVVPGSAQPGTQVAGTLQLDDIRLQ
jgi:hypothetical protein